MSKEEIKDENLYYDLELANLIEEINENNYKYVVLQLPDGLKQYSTDIVDILRSKTSNTCEFFIYFGTCYGACDIPLHLKELSFDLCVQWGHSHYKKRRDMW